MLYKTHPISRSTCIKPTEQNIGPETNLVCETHGEVGRHYNEHRDWRAGCSPLYLGCDHYRPCVVATEICIVKSLLVT